MSNIVYSQLKECNSLFKKLLHDRTFLLLESAVFLKRYFKGLPCLLDENLMTDFDKIR